MGGGGGAQRGHGRQCQLEQIAGALHARAGRHQLQTAQHGQQRDGANGGPAVEHLRGQ